MTSESSFDDALKRDRLVVFAGIALMITLAWAYTVRLALTNDAMSGGIAMPNLMPWSATDLCFMLIMWIVMMVAMMLPSATPMILIFDRVQRKRETENRPYAPVAAFVAGYLLIWVVFSIVATLINFGLHQAGALSSMMGQVSPALGGVLLLCAGLFQWTPLKRACLNHCRSPIGFLMSYWREGSLGATIMGVHHGAYCIGCCWMLMILLFVLGVMNLPWVAVLAIVVLAEKVVPRGETLSKVLGAVLVVWGGWLIVSFYQIAT